MTALTPEADIATEIELGDISLPPEVRFRGKSGHRISEAEWQLLAEAVEELGFQVVREFVRFCFAREEWHQSPSQRLYAPSGQGFGSVCRSLRVDNARQSPVGKKNRALCLQTSSSTPSAKSGHGKPPVAWPLNA